MFLTEKETGVYSWWPCSWLNPISTQLQKDKMHTKKSPHLLYFMKVKVLFAQSCLTLWDPMTVAHQAPLSMGILHARILEWVAMPSSRGSSQPRDRGLPHYSCILYLLSSREALYIVYLNTTDLSHNLRWIPPSYLCILKHLFHPTHWNTFAVFKSQPHTIM